MYCIPTDKIPLKSLRFLSHRQSFSYFLPVGCEYWLESWCYFVINNLVFLPYQCCACFGPKGKTGDFCSPACQGINGGTVTKNAHTWFWVRTSPPRKPVWNRCVEFEIKTPEGVTETHFINGKTGIVTKVGVEDGGKLLFFASCAHH
jgi:hypothetical protein